MTDARNNLPAYQNTFDRAKGFQRLAHHWDRFLTANELNVAQDIEANRVKQIADAFWRDGSLVSGGAIVLGPIVNATVEARLAAAKVYIRGAVHDIEARNLVVSAVGTVVIGIRLRTYTVSYEDDPTLKGQAPGTRAQGEPGASALVMKGRWGFEGDGEEGDFFPIHTIKDGVIDTPVEPGMDDAWANLLARYDREAHGGYVVEGFKVQALGLENAKQVFTVSEGTINVYGYKRTRPASYRLRVDEEPEVLLIDDEPHAVNSGTQTIVVRFAPIAEILEVTIIAEKTVTLTHGAFTGVSDALPDPTVLSIREVKQGATVYAATTSYKLTGAAVDWSPGGAEVAPGSTYQVTYQYLTNAVPTNIQRDRFDITGAANDTTAFLKYKTKLPRFDAVVADQTGAISYLKGISSLYAPQVVVVPPTLHKLADVENLWGLVPNVRQVATVRMPFNDLRSLEGMVGDLYALVSEERLQRDVDRKEVAAKRGVFVDPLIDDDMRDQGIVQTGAIFSGKLWLPVIPTVTTLPVLETTLSYIGENVFEQRQITGETKINPYQVFGPPATDVALNPSVDLWTDTQDVWTSINTSRTVMQYFGTHVFGQLMNSQQEVIDRVTSSNTVAQETIRTRNVTFTINKWGFNELLKSVKFDDIDVTPAGEIRADANGTLVSSFAIPAGVPVGVKHVAFEGFGGSKANALYTAYGWTTTVMNERTVITTFWYESDPVAQTFRLQEPRQVLGVDVKFTKIGDRNKPVRIQIREVELGIPTERVVAEALIDMHTVTAIDPLSVAPRTEADWTFARFERATTLREDRSYSITILTEDGTHSVAIADLGGFDQINGWVTSNAFTAGTFLDGSDARTWLPKPGRSLTFRLRTAKYSPVTRTVEIGEVNVVACSDLMPLLVSERPENTAIEVEFEAPNGAKYITGPSVNVQLPSAITGAVKVRLRLTGSSVLAPQMLPYIQVVAGAIQAEGDYVSRAFDAGTDSKVRLICDVYLPSTSTFTANIQSAVGGDGLPVWSAPTLEKATPLGDGWEERQYMLDHVNSAITRGKVKITGGPSARSNVRSIRIVAVKSTTG
ncbi:DUF4815 domain-containing protein [Tardiphaga sp. 709]|uniref:DUF4815 domain-containing protein n=1 Tax=Tardiphaga sp. 709 TaxID=3076039 RepID=UPI0028EE6936|nr:DUF4815 domain-containing protein [Tardiphaga sp. 709]WNV10093.1 DUF4815 domain-containing protein [Tardiphaga sp. 709]